MGGVISALAAAGAAISASLIAAAESAGLIAIVYSIANSAIYTGLTAASIAGFAVFGGTAATVTLAVGISVFASVPIGFVLTTTGYAVLIGMLVSAGLGTIIGVTSSIKSGPPTDTTILYKIQNQQTLLCLLNRDKNECGRVYSNPRKRTVRIQPRKTKERSMLSYAAPHRVYRNRQNSSNKNAKASSSRKIPVKVKRLRRKGRK